MGTDVDGLGATDLDGRVRMMVRIRAVPARWSMSSGSTSAGRSATEVADRSLILDWATSISLRTTCPISPQWDRLVALGGSFGH